MSRFHTLPALLLALSRGKRLALVVVSTLVSLLVFWLLPAPARNPAVLCVPVALSAWLFQMSGVLLSATGIELAQWALYGLEVRNSFLAPSTLSRLLIELLAFAGVGLLISALRSMLDHANTERQHMLLAYQKLQEEQQSRDQYIAHIAHELRTSLTSVNGYLDLLDEQDALLDKETRDLFLHYAKEGSNELVESVSTILETMRSNVEARSMKIEPVVVREVVQEAIERLAPQLVQSHPISIEIDDQVAVYADAQYLHQVVRNLLSNAFKYSPSRSPVTIRADQVALEGAPCPLGQIRISIQDRGLGVPSSEQTRIFQRFVRLERDISGPVDGSGIGLYTSKQLVEEMGGRIWVESSGIKGEGSTFCFVLPRAFASPADKNEAMLALFSF